jgi:hypothetical protein
MKKFLAILVSLVMVMALTVTAFASEATKNTPSATVATFTSEDATFSVNTNEEARLAVEEGESETTAFLFNVESESNTIHVGNIEIKGLVRVIHWEDGKWVEVEASYADKTLTVTSENGWSPIAVIVKTGDSVAPDTGDMTVVFVACAAVMACAAAAFAVKSKKAA